MSAVGSRGLAVSASNRRLLAAARERLEAAPPGRGVWVVAATRGAARDLLADLARAGDGLLGARGATLAELAAELAVPELARRGLAPVSALGAEALAARSAAAALDAGELAYFDEVASLPGFAAALARTLGELSLWEIAAEELEGAGAPGRDLARLRARRQESLERWGLADRARLLELAAAALDGGGGAPAPPPLLFLDAPLATPAEERFCARLVASSSWAHALCLAPDEGAVAAWRRCLAALPLDLDAATPGDASRLERVRRHLFDPAEQTPAESDDGSVTFLAAPGEGRECVEVARRIRALAARGRPFDSMAVLLRDPLSYLPVVEEALQRADLPAWHSSGVIRPDPAGRAFLALLTCAAENLSASRFAEYLSLGQVPPLAEAGAPPTAEPEYVPADDPQLSFKFVAEGEPGADAEEPRETDAEPAPAGSLAAPFQWERLLVDAAVVGGRDRWARRLEGLEAELLRRARHVAEEDDTRRRQLLDQVERIRHLKRFALPLIEDLADLPARAEWGVWLTRLERLAARSLRQPERVLSLLAELAPMSELGPVGLDEVRRTLSARLTELRGAPPGSRHGRVFVGTVAEARGREFEVVFLPGLAEGSFPRRAGEDPLLLDHRRVRLPGPPPTRTERAAEERLLLRIAAAAAAERLVVSYPSLDPRLGRPRVPSFYALDLLRAAEGELPDLAALERRAVTASASVLGFPAARDPEQAIDDAEFDLSVLEPLLRSPGEAPRGSARYLLEVSAPLHRSLRARAERWRRRFYPSDGLVEPQAEAARLLREEHPRRRAYSPTALQAYAACPYRFLLHGVHRLRPRETPSPLERLDPLTRGSLFHEAQFDLLSRLREDGLLPVTRDNRDEVLAAAAEVLDVAARRFEEELAPAIPRVWKVEMDDLRIDFRGWIDQMAAEGEGWRPVRFEWSFGLPPAEGRDAGSREEPAVILDGYRVRGAVDLIEEREGRLRVTDHKTGRARPERSLAVGGGEVLQPLLYALAAEALLEQPVEEGRLSYCTRRGGYHVIPVALGEYQKLQVEQVLAIVGEAVEEGFLPAAPREGACAFCDYRPVCGPLEERRVARKPRRPLARLEELRRLD
ncbi:MAG: PD-(D/E)XK nuclease family protein [Thermoanaerobaculia bacterium]|nr:PD-(D/E)XK nuclease family protein [Thermoanaerobaculia bacterium]